LNAIRRAAHIEVDLVIAHRLPERGGLRRARRLGAAELKRHGMLLRAEGEKTGAVAMENGAGRQHLRVKPCLGASKDG